MPGFFEHFRDGLNFPPIQGGDRPNWIGAVKALALGLDNLGARSIAVRDEHLPQVCCDERVEAHAQERGIKRLPSETDVEHRSVVSQAHAFHSIVGRRAGFKRAVERATAKPYSLTLYGRDGWRIGRPGFAVDGINAAGLHHAAIIEFADVLTADELEAVKDSVHWTGQAFRDVVYYVVPTAPLGLWRIARAGFGLEALGPLWFDLADVRYYLGEYLLAGATASTDSEDASYPFANLFDLNHNTAWRSVDLDVWLKADLKSAQQVTSTALLDHNLTSGATITLEANSTDSWVSPAYSQVLTWTEGHLVLSLDQTYRWWRLVIDDPTNPDGFLTAIVWHLGPIGQVS
ncbi:MAG: hypothetical protein JRC92_10465 [Deltaproteobacteria bacterium]|nr:hypothetical protein [Deltaproteobacteria bacterium]